MPPLLSEQPEHEPSPEPTPGGRLLHEPRIWGRNLIQISMGENSKKRKLVTFLKNILKSHHEGGITMWSSAHGPITSPALLLGESSGEALPLLCSLWQALTPGQMRRLKVNKTGAGTPLGKLQALPHLKAGKWADACVHVPGFLLYEMWRETNRLQGVGTTSGSHRKKNTVCESTNSMAPCPQCHWISSPFYRVRKGHPPGIVSQISGQAGSLFSRRAEPKLALSH